MKILLIDFNDDIGLSGIRCISSYLKKNGHDVYLLFSPLTHSDRSRLSNKHEFKESKEELQKIVNLAKKLDPKLIGISLTSSFYYRAVNLTQAIKKELNVPVIWGGIQPTTSPESCFDYADLLAIGEAEESFLELTNKMEKGENYSDTPGIWLKKDNKIIMNPLHPLTEDLDKFPMPDYDLKTQYILHQGEIRDLNMGMLKKYAATYFNTKGVYRIICSRGCPYRCSYCHHSVGSRGYPNPEKYHRRRSAEHIMKELEWVKNNLDFIKLIRISDDSFLSATDEWVRKFSEEYKKRVGLPFSCLIYPMTVTPKKIQYLYEAGVKHIQMGVQSTERVNKEIYNRPTTDKQVLDAINLLNSKKGVVCEYDMIIDNPYETEEDKKNKIKLALQFPKPYILTPYSLVIYKPTPLYDRAKQDGTLGSEEEYLNKNMSYTNNEYLNSLLLLTPHLPKSVISHFLEKEDSFNIFSLNLIRHIIFDFVIKLPISVKNAIKNIVPN